MIDCANVLILPSQPLPHPVASCSVLYFMSKFQGVLSTQKRTQQCYIIQLCHSMVELNLDLRVMTFIQLSAPTDEEGATSRGFWWNMFWWNWWYGVSTYIHGYWSIHVYLCLFTYLNHLNLCIYLYRHIEHQHKVSEKIVVVHDPVVSQLPPVFRWYKRQPVDAKHSSGANGATTTVGRWLQTVTGFGFFWDIHWNAKWVHRKFLALYASMWFHMNMLH